MRLSRQSPEEALESLYRRHLRDTFGYALGLLGSPADAEDATQATFLNAYRALQQGERPRHATSWLRAIALNVCREHFRRESRRLDEVSLEDDPGELVAEPEGPAIGDVIRALRHLPFNQRSALVMREFEGRSLAEIAQRLEVTSSAVETLLFRARRALREQLDSSLRCDQAERAISRQLDGGLPRSERGALRAHLRACPECASLARRLRAQRSTLKSLALVPVPASLAWSKLAGPAAAGGGTSVAATASIAGGGLAGLGLKAAGGAILAALAVGAGYATLRHHAPLPPAPAVTAAASPRVAGAERFLSPARERPAVPARATVSTASRRTVSTARRGTVSTVRSHATRQADPAQAANERANGSRSGQRGSNPGRGQGQSRAQGQNQASGHGRSQGRGKSAQKVHRRQGPATTKPHPATARGSAHSELLGQSTAHGHQ